MHELLALYSGWSASLYGWARTLVGIVLWFWVVSGAIFGLRFLAFVLLENHSGSNPLATASPNVPFPIKRFKKRNRRGSTQE